MPHWTKRTTSDSRRANGGVRRSAAPVDDYMDKRGEYEPFFAVCFIFSATDSGTDQSV